MTSHNITTGKKGEQIACDFLQKRGYTIITTNWHCQFGEIDIIAQKDTKLIFVEVKTRRTSSTEFAFSSITQSKREKFINAVYLYLDENKLDNANWCIDVIAIALQNGGTVKIDHREDAFDW